MPILSDGMYGFDGPPTATDTRSAGRSGGDFPFSDFHHTRNDDSASVAGAVRPPKATASQYTTPPYSWCMATCECSACAMRPRSVSYTATPVSSQEVSMPNTSKA